MTSPRSTESIFFIPQTQSHNQPIRAMRPLMLMQTAHDRNRFRGGGKDSGHTTGQQVPWTNQSSSLGRNRQSESFRQNLSKANVKIGTMTWPDENNDNRSRNQFSERSLPSSNIHLPKIHRTFHDNPHLPNPQKDPAISQSHSSLSKSYSFPSCHNINTRRIPSVDVQHHKLHPAYMPPSASYPSYFQPRFLGCSTANPSSIQRNHNSTAVKTSQPCVNSDNQCIFRNLSRLPSSAQLTQLPDSHKAPLPHLPRSYKAQLPHQSGFHNAPRYRRSTPRQVPLSSPSNPPEVPCFQGSKHVKVNWPVHRIINTPNYHFDKSAGHLQLNISKPFSPSDESHDTSNNESIRNNPSCHINTKGSTKHIPNTPFIQAADLSVRDFDDYKNSHYSLNMLQNAAQQYSQRSSATCQRSQTTVPQRVRNASFSHAVSQSGVNLLGHPNQVLDEIQDHYNSTSPDRFSEDNVQPRKHSQTPQGYSNMQPVKQMSFSTNHSSQQHQNLLCISKSHSIPQSMKYVPISQSHSNLQPSKMLPIPRSHSIPQSHSSKIPYNKRNAHSESNNQKQHLKYVISSEGNYKTPNSSNQGGGHNNASQKIPAGSWFPASHQLLHCSTSYPDLSLLPAARTSSEARQRWSKFPHRQKQYPRSKSHEAHMDLNAHNNSQTLKHLWPRPRHKVSFFSETGATNLYQKRILKPYLSENDVIDSKKRYETSQQRHSDVCYVPRNDTAVASLHNTCAVRTNKSCKVELQEYTKGEMSESCTSFISGQEGHEKVYCTGDNHNRSLHYHKSGDKSFQKDNYLRIFSQSRNPGYGKVNPVKAQANISPSQRYWHPDFEKRLQRLREEFQEYKQQKQASQQGQPASLTASSALSKGVNKSSMYSMDSEML